MSLSVPPVCAGSSLKLCCDVRGSIKRDFNTKIAAKFKLIKVLLHIPNKR